MTEEEIKKLMSRRGKKYNTLIDGEKMPTFAEFKRRWEKTSSA